MQIPDIASRKYDVNDLRSISEGGGLTEYYYDRIGRLSDVNDPEGRWVSYEYNSRSLRTKLIYPDDSFVTYKYDALGRLTEIEDQDGNSIAQYQYDELSRRTLVTLGNDANAVYDYDLANRLTKLTNNIDDTTSIVFDYANYDKVGNRLSCKVDETEAHVYTYDNLYQLIFVDYNDGNSTDYYYDALGNRTSVDDGSVTIYDSNCLNQYTAVGPQGSQTSSLYDKNGNLTNDGTYLYYYDCENRLTDVNNQSDQPVASYKYDYLGRRVKKTIHDTQTTIHYTYDGAQVIAEYEGDTLVRKFIYGPGIDEPIMMIDVADSDTVYYYHFDGLGSVVALSDTSANIIERYSYDVFGDPNRISDVNNPYLFTGRRYDDETGFYYYRARYYAPEIGRFLQTDPIGYVAGLNLYAYCGNNPVNWVDPLGLCKEKKISGLRAYSQEVFTWPLNIGEEATRIEREEYPDYIDPFAGDYRHFVAAGMLARNYGLLSSALYLEWHQRHESDPLDIAAEWRGWRQAWRHPFTPLRELGKDYTVRPIGGKRKDLSKDE